MPSSTVLPRPELSTTEIISDHFSYPDLQISGALERWIKRRRFLVLRPKFADSTTVTTLVTVDGVTATTTTGNVKIQALHGTSVIQFVDSIS